MNAATRWKPLSCIDKDEARKRYDSRNQTWSNIAYTMRELYDHTQWWNEKSNPGMLPDRPRLEFHSDKAKETSILCMHIDLQPVVWKSLVGFEVTCPQHDRSLVCHKFIGYRRDNGENPASERARKKSNQSN